MTAKQELLEIVEGLGEDEAERLLPQIKQDLGHAAGGTSGQSNIGRLLELMEQWRTEDEALDPAERTRLDAVFDNIEPVRFRLPEEL